MNNLHNDRLIYFNHEWYVWKLDHYTYTQKYNLLTLLDERFSLLFTFLVVQWYTFKNAKQTKKFFYFFLYSDSCLLTILPVALLSLLSLPLFIYNVNIFFFSFFWHCVCVAWLYAVHPLMRAAESQKRDGQKI